MKKLGTLLIAFAVVAICVFLLPTEVQAATSGTCGDNLTWTLDDEGTLTISGTGAMWDLAWQEEAPWKWDCFSIKSVVIEEGVTSIGNYAFSGCQKLTNEVISNGITSISANMFSGCYKLTSVVISDSVTDIVSEAFAECINLTDVYYNGTESDWDVITIGIGNAYIFAATLHCTDSCDHIWGDDTVTKQATCNEYGQKTYTCSSCGSTKTEPLPITNAHSYNGVVTKDATCKEAGVMTFTCSVCGDSYNEEIENSTEHSYAEGVCTVCGSEDPDYVAPEEPSKPEEPSEPTVPSEPEDPSEPTEPDEEESVNPIMAILNAILEALKALLAIFGIKL